MALPELVQSTAGFVFLLGALFALPLIGRLVLGPVSQAAGVLNAPRRFQLSDFVWLVVQLQIVLALTVQFVGLESGGYFAPLLAFSVFATVAMWGGAVSFLSRAGVRHAGRRAVFILLVLPGTLAVMVAAPILVASVGLALVNYAAGPEAIVALSWARLAGAASLSLAAASGLAAVGWCLRKLSLWIVSGVMLFNAEMINEQPP